MIKVGIYYYSSIRAANGASTVLRNIIEGFSKSKNYSMQLFSIDKNSIENGGRKLQYRYRLVPFLLRKIKELIHKFLFISSMYSVFFSNIYIKLKYFRNARKVLERNYKSIAENDILFFHDIFTSYTFKTLYSRHWNSKKKLIVLHTNGSPLKMLYDYFPKIYWHKRSREFYSKEVVLSVLKDVDRIVLLSNLAMKNFLIEYPQFVDKISIVPNGIRKEIIEIGHYNDGSKFNFVTVGTVCHRKGHDILIQSIIDLSDDERSLFDLQIIGTGKMELKLKEKCISHNIDNVHFLGKKSNVEDFLLKANCFILGSRDEGLPMAIIEALASGLPIISTNVGGIPDLIKEGVNGFLINPNSTEELREAILKILKLTSDERTKMGVESQKYFLNNFTQKIMVKRYANIFGELE